jgi:hypothetical protein
MKLFEGNIEPYIRYMHLNGISPCGWIKILAKNYSHSNDKNYISNKTTFSISV